MGKITKTFSKLTSLIIWRVNCFTSFSQVKSAESFPSINFFMKLYRRWLDCSFGSSCQAETIRNRPDIPTTFHAGHYRSSFCRRCDACLGLIQKINWTNFWSTFQVKAGNKMKLAQYLEETTGVTINPASMFDIQVYWVFFSWMLFYRWLI